MVHGGHGNTHLTLNSYTDFENFSVFTPTGPHEETLNMVLDQVKSWGTALKPVHQQQPGNPATVLRCALLLGIL
jgi:hypothetical protein